MDIRILLFIILSSALTCCSGRPSDIRLSRVEELASASPKEALDSLDAINYDMLTEADRQYYDFLSVKVSDKAYIKHSSDSLILKVIANEKNHLKRGRYTEALYYGGRVYHDLGNLPTALNYYQNALETLEDDGKDMALESRIRIQTGELLNTLRLYDQAATYVEKAAKLDSIAQDSLNLIYDLELLGDINLHARNYDSAERLFNNARSLAHDRSPADTTSINAHLAAVRYYLGDFDSALFFIKKALKDTSQINSDMTLAYASLIYHRKNEADSALTYARRLIESKSFANRRIGYKVLLSPEFKGHSDPDSLLDYIYDFWNEMEACLNKNGDRQALIQNSFYNYQLHLKERIRAETENKSLRYGIEIILFILLLSVMGMLYLKNRNKSQRIKLHEAINNINLLRLTLDKSEERQKKLTDKNSNACPDPDSSSNPKSSDIQLLRVRLRENLLSLRNSANQSHPVSQKILESDTYEMILKNIRDKNIIPEKSPLWGELEKVVAGSYPEFKSRLHILAGGKLKPAYLHLALLIKCGISSTDISVLVGRAKSTISYRKDTLGVKVFGEKMETGMIDDIIHLL